MQIADFIRLRLSRGFSLNAVGPNEARILFDAAVAFASSLLALAFCRAYAPAGRRGRDYLLPAALPVLLIAFNLVLGVYTRLRLAFARTKALALCASVLLSAGLAWGVVGNPPLMLLWAMLVTGPIVLARLLLSLHTGRHRTLARIAISRRGPVLVIGGAGYIGSETVSLLLSRGHSVRVLDRLMYGRQSLAEFGDHPHFTLIEGDTTDIAKLTVAMKDCSAVVHLAGLVGDPACAVSPEFTRHANIVATRMAKEVAAAMGIHRFIFASSCSVYGASEKEVGERDALNPVSLYAQTKIDSERELLSTVRDEFFVTVLRFATIFGHSRRPRFDLVANLFTAQAMTDGLITVVGPGQWRPFIHVRDLARAILTVLEADRRLVQSQIFNVGDERLNMTILQLAKCVRDVASKYRLVNICVTDSPQDRRNYAVSFKKIRSTVGLQAETGLEEGIQEMVARFLAGGYGNYRSPEYSNVAMTAKALSAFQDPAEMEHLYAPLNVS
jgi:nucleoside-diphosphate-sugar epimerase